MESALKRNLAALLSSRERERSLSRIKDTMRISPLGSESMELPDDEQQGGMSMDDIDSGLLKLLGSCRMTLHHLFFMLPVFNRVDDLLGVSAEFVERGYIRYCGAVRPTGPRREAQGAHAKARHSTLLLRDVLQRDQLDGLR